MQTHWFFFLEESDDLSRDFFSLLKFAFGCTPFQPHKPDNRSENHIEQLILFWF